jgi:hypothetical protein
MRFQFKFSSNSSLKLKYIFHLNMVDLWSKCLIRKLCQIVKSIFMPNFTFSEVPNYFSYFYSLLLVYSIGNGFKMKKISVGRFLYGRPSSAPTLAHLHTRAGLPARYRTTVTDKRGSPVGSSSPKSSPVARSMALPPQFPPMCRPPITTP